MGPAGEERIPSTQAGGRDPKRRVASWRQTLGDEWHGKCHGHVRDSWMFLRKKTAFILVMIIYIYVINCYYMFIWLYVICRIIMIL